MALDLGELSVRLSAEDQLTNALNGAQQSARRTEQVTSQAATGITASTQRMAQGYQQLQREATTYATASERANSRAQTATEQVRIAQERLDAAQRDSSTSADQLEAAQRRVATATSQAERETRNAEQATDRMEAAHRRAARAAEQGGRDAVDALERTQRELRATEQQAEQSGDAAGSGFADRFTSGIEGMGGRAEGAGGSAGGSFIAGFAPRVAGLGAKGGPIGAALAGVAVLGLAAGAILANAIADGMEQEANQDLIQAKLGIDEETARRIGEAAGLSYSSGWGESVAENMDAARAAIQSGMLTGEEDTGTFKATIDQLNIVSEIMGEDIPNLTRSASQAVKTGFAVDAPAALDMFVKAQQVGLNTSEDFLDTIDEYGIQFKKLGLDGPEAMGLLSQAVKNGARDTDTAADALKEFSIRAVDGSKSSSEAFQILGMNAEDMTAKISLGGQDAQDGLEQVLVKLREMEPGVDRTTAAVGLFGTKAEDMGDALYTMDLSTAVKQLGDVEGAAANAGNTMSSNTAASFESASRSIETSADDIKLALAQAFGPALTDVANWVTTHKPEIIAFFTGLAEAGLNTGIAMASFAADTLRVLANLAEGTAKTLGGMVGAMGNLVSVSSSVARALGMDGVADKLEGASDAMIGFQDGLEGSADSMRGMADNIDGAIPSLEDLRDGVVAAGDRAETSARLMQALGSAVVNDIPDDKTIIIDSNTPEQQAALEALGLKVERLPDGTFKVTSNTEDGQLAIDAFIGNNTGKNIDMFVDLRQRQIGYWQSQGVSEQDAPSMQGPTPYLNAGGGAPAAPGTFDGGGGGFADGKLPQEALIKSAGGKGLVQWAEEGAGPWEAFIPGAESKRPRAVGILKDVADRFGYGLVQMADGGIVSGLSNLASENFPALTMTSGYRAGDPGYHGSGQAADFSNGSDNTPEQLAFANFMVDNYKPKLLELIYSAPGFDKNVKNGSIVDGSFYGASTMAGHRNHVHVAMSQPPGEPSSDPGSYDVGAQALTVTDYGQPDSSSAGMSSGSRSRTLPTSSGPVDVRVINFADIGGAAPDGRTPKMVGNLKVFANGGIESQNPEIATTGGNVRVWAEPQAGPWEAYIPGDPAKRARAVDIWRETGKRLNVTEFADGGFGGYNEPKSRDYMRPTNLYEAASLAAGLGFTAASGVGGFLSMAQSGQVDLSQLMPQFDTGSNDIPGLSEAFTQLVAPLEEILATLKKGGLVTADVNVDTSNGSVALDLLSTGLA
ncbi:phage tail tape measure protein [Rhodococcus sp. NPDC006774]|uniref:phage tail tape measure protein n=1 Tax=Rhodococcus sp. NPDC006774 TaxID=3157186 RepID=UPI0033D28AD5